MSLNKAVEKTGCWLGEMKDTRTIQDRKQDAEDTGFKIHSMCLFWDKEIYTLEEG